MVINQFDNLISNARHTRSTQSTSKIWTMVIYNTHCHPRSYPSHTLSLSLKHINFLQIIPSNKLRSFVYHFTRRNLPIIHRIILWQLNFIGNLHAYDSQLHQQNLGNSVRFSKICFIDFHIYLIYFNAFLHDLRYNSLQSNPVPQSFSNVMVLQWNMECRSGIQCSWMSSVQYTYQKVVHVAVQHTDQILSNSVNSFVVIFWI